jgi:hypothetical protein
MAKYKKRIELAEEKCRQGFISYLGDKYDRLLVPEDTFSSFDLLAISGDEEHYFELKMSEKYYINYFREDGAMIDVKKWNSLIQLSQNHKYVFYMRMYKDGFAVWHMNSLTNNDWKEGNYIRKTITMSNSNNTQTKSKCVLINFEAALHIHQKDIFIKRVT